MLHVAKVNITSRVWMRPVRCSVLCVSICNNCLASACFILHYSELSTLKRSAEGNWSSPFSVHYTRRTLAAPQGHILTGTLVKLLVFGKH